MIDARVLRIAAVALAAGLVGIDTTAAADERPATTAAANDGAPFRRAWEAERVYRLRLARLHRLRAIAQRRGDTDRVAEIEGLFDRLQERHDARRARWRHRFDQRRQRLLEEGCDHADWMKRRAELRQRRKDRRADRRQRLHDHRAELRENRLDHRLEAREDRLERRHDRQENRMDRRHDRQEDWMDLRHDRQESRMDRRHDRQERRMERRPEWQQDRIERRHDRQEHRLDRRHDRQEGRMDRRHDRQEHRMDRRHDLRESRVDRRHDRRELRRRPSGAAGGAEALAREAAENDRSRQWRSAARGMLGTRPNARPLIDEHGDVRLPTTAEVDDVATRTITEDNFEAELDRLRAEVEQDQD